MINNVRMMFESSKSKLLLDSNSLRRLTWIKTETWLTCQVISSNKSSYVAAVAWTAGAGSCSNRWDCCCEWSCSNRWDCCHEQKVAAIAGIAVLMTELQQSPGLLSRIELQQSLGLLSRTEGCSSCRDCCYEHKSVSNRWTCCYEHESYISYWNCWYEYRGRSWSLPLLTV